MEGLSYELELVDHISGAAHKGAESLEDLAKAALHAELSIKGIGTIAFGELLAESVKKLGEGVLEFGEGVADVAVEGVKFALEMSEFKENSIDAYTAILGTAEEGEKAFEEIETLGRGIHMPVEKSQEMAQQLMEQGLENTNAVEGVIQAVSDLQRTGNERGAGKLEKLVEKTLASGSFDAKGKALAGTGLHLPELVSQIADDLHEPVAQVKAEMKAGKINAQEGIDAIINVFEHSKIHQIAEQKFSLGDLVVDLKNDVKSLFEDVNAGPLLDALHDLSWVVGESTDKTSGLKGAVTDTFDSIMGTIGPVVDEIIILGQEIEIGFLRAWLATKPLREEFDKIGLTSDDWETLELTIQGVTMLLVEGAVYAARLGNEIIHVLELVTGTGPEAEKSGGGLGTAIVEGLANAITGGGALVSQVTGNLVSKAIGGGRKAAESNSPSRKMFDLGSDMTEGLLLGLDESRAEVERMVADVATPPEPTSPDAGGGGGGRSVTIQDGAIQAHIHVQGTSVSADEIREGATAALEDVLEQLILELGG